MVLVVLTAGFASLAGAAAPPPECKLFTAAEMSAYLGERVQAGEAASLGEGCVWYPVDDDSDGQALLQQFPKQKADNPRLDPRYKDRPDIGEGAYLIKDMSVFGSWTGGVVAGESFYRIFLLGPTATEARATAWLKKLATLR
jgi:hypothetical protein